MKQFVWAVAMAGLSSCALPSRDNRFDPSSAPEVKVNMIDYSVGAPGTSCPAFTGAGTAVGAASRGRCLALDASATIDRGGRAVSGSAFTWTLVDDAGTATQPPFAATGATLVLTSSF